MDFYISILDKKSTQLFQSGFYYPDIEMERFHFFKLKHIPEFLTQDIHLPGHHLEKHDQMIWFQIHELFKHDSIIIEPVITSHESRFRLKFFDIISDILFKGIFGNIRQISDKNSILS